MPFGLDLVSMIVGALLAMFVIPMLMNAIAGFTAPAAPQRGA